jgi:hypothetical protein
MAPTPPTKEQLEAALALVLAYSADRTQGGAYLGLSYSSLAKSQTLTPSFQIGREHRYWLIDLDQWAASRRGQQAQP